MDTEGFLEVIKSFYQCHIFYFTVKILYVRANGVAFDSFLSIMKYIQFPNLHPLSI